jgi:hypothetical protein
MRRRDRESTAEMPCHLAIAHSVAPHFCAGGASAEIAGNRAHLRKISNRT